MSDTRSRGTAPRAASASASASPNDASSQFCRISARTWPAPLYKSRLSAESARPTNACSASPAVPRASRRAARMDSMTSRGLSLLCSSADADGYAVGGVCNVTSCRAPCVAGFGDKLASSASLALVTATRAASRCSARSARTLYAAASARAACSSERKVDRLASLVDSSRFDFARRTRSRPERRPKSSTAFSSALANVRRRSWLRCSAAASSSSASSSSAARASRLVPPVKNSTRSSMAARLSCREGRVFALQRTFSAPELQRTFSAP